MTVSSVNNLISFQESQLIQMLQQQAARARADAGAEHRQAWMTSGGQNLPGADATAAPADQSPTPRSESAAIAAWEPSDPSLSPDNINALMLALQTQQASLDTTLLLDNSTAGPGGRTLVDYLTDPDAVTADAANDDDAQNIAQPLIGG